LRKAKFWLEATPEQIQRKVYEREWEKAVEVLPYGKEVLKGKRKEKLAQYILEQIEGYRFSPKKLEELTPDEMGAIWAFTEEHQQALARLRGISYKYIPNVLLPSRKVFGAGEVLFGTVERIYNPLKKMFGEANKYEFEKALDFYVRIEKAGLGKVKLKRAGDKITSFKITNRAYSKEDWENLGRLARDLDQMAQDGVEEALRKSHKQTFSTAVQRLYDDVWLPWHDQLMKEHYLYKIPQILSDMKLSSHGKRELDKLMNEGGGIADSLELLFRPDLNLPYKVKQEGLGTILAKVKETIDSSWFMPRGKGGAEKISEALEREFRFSKPGSPGFPNYVENYAIRIATAASRKATARAMALVGNRKAGYVQSRARVSREYIADTSRMLETRARAQAKEIFVHPRLPGIIRYAKGLPYHLAEYTEHYISRMLGEPSLMDWKVADFLSSWIGEREAALGRLLGKEDVLSGVWDARRVQELGYKLNDLVYLGALGFKPFSAIRNLFQPLLTVPTDLGGVKDIGWLSIGMKKAFKKETREYIQSIGGIQEFAPDIYLRPRMMKFGPKVGGVQLPDLQAIRDTGLWMFQQSDKWNRYVSGAAAMAKWEAKAQRYLKGETPNLEMFAKAMKFHNRDRYVREEISGLLRKYDPKLPDTREFLNEAKAKFVLDVIADTQWLYGIAEAPAASYRLGALTRTGLIFQSWWMNYIAALEKWFVSGGKLAFNEKVGRTITMMLSQAIAYQLMTSGVGFSPSTAGRSIFLGPVPRGISGFSTPPAWAPIAHFLNASRLTVENIALSAIAPDQVDWSKLKSSIKALSRSSMLMVPGGLQMMQTYRRVKKGGSREFLPSLVGIKRNE